MTLKKKLKAAIARNDYQEAERLQKRLNRRKARWAIAKTAMLNTAATVAGRFGIPIPSFTNNLNINTMNKFNGISGFLGEMMKRLFADKPRFFVWGQRITGILGTLLVALKFISDPSTGINLYDQVCLWSFCFVPEVVINYAIAVCLGLIGAFQLPTPSLSDKAEAPAK